MVKCLAYLSHQSQASSQALSTALSASTSGDTCDAGFCQNWRSQPRQSMGFFHRKWWFHQPKRCLTSETCVSQPTVWPNVRWVAGFDPPATAPEPRKVVRFACFAGISKKRSTARRHLRKTGKLLDIKNQGKTYWCVLRRVAGWVGLPGVAGMMKLIVSQWIIP